MTRILFVDDEPRILDGLRRSLRPKRKSWELRFAEGGAAALAQLDAEPADAVVTDMRMPSIDGAELLGRVQERHPATLRIVLSGYTDLDTAVRAAPVAHQFLPKPCEPLLLIETLERNLRACEGAAPALRRTIGGVRLLPSPAENCAELQSLLEARHPSIPAIASLIDRDVAIAAQLLHLVSSSFFGRPRALTSSREAIEHLGVKILRDLHAAGGLARPVEPERARELAISNRHAVSVARLAEELAEGQIADVYLPALLHDVGLWLDPPVSSEHGAQGWSLLALWGLPANILEAAREHHAATVESSPLVRLVAAADARARRDGDEVSS